MWCTLHVVGSGDGYRKQNSSQLCPSVGSPDTKGHAGTTLVYVNVLKHIKQVNVLCPELWYYFLFKLSKQQQLICPDHRLSLEFYLRSGEITGCKLYTIPQQTQWFKRKMKSRFTVFTTNTVFGLMFIKLMGKILKRWPIKGFFIFICLLTFSQKVVMADTAPAVGLLWNACHILKYFQEPDNKIVLGSHSTLKTWKNEGTPGKPGNIM